MATAGGMKIVGINIRIHIYIYRLTFLLHILCSLSSFYHPNSPRLEANEAHRLQDKQGRKDARDEGARRCKDKQPLLGARGVVLGSLSTRFPFRFPFNCYEMSGSEASWKS